MKKLTRLGASQLPFTVMALPLLVVATLFLAVTQLQAQNPKISIQGTLKTANGASVADGTYSVTFKLYNVETGGTALWQEDASVEVVGGIYSHYLGSVTPLNPGNFSSNLWLGVKVGSYELVPRSELSYSPYAVSVAFAQKVVCSGAVGDVKYSILNPTQFAAENGDCWVPLDGRALAATDRLKSTYGFSALPDAGGLFIRAQEFSGGADNDPDRSSGSTIAQVQQDELESHNHTMNSAGAHSHPMGTRGFTGDGLKGADGSGDDQDAFTQSAGAHTHTINNTGGAETRPKNLNLWVYIRIN